MRVARQGEQALDRRGDRQFGGVVDVEVQAILGQEGAADVGDRHPHRAVAEVHAAEGPDLGLSASRVGGRPERPTALSGSPVSVTRPWAWSSPMSLDTVARDSEVARMTSTRGAGPSRNR